MIPAGELTGAVLAGGQSRRMGRDKSLLEVAGQPLWARQAAVLHAAGAVTVGLVRRPDQTPLVLPTEIPLWMDAVTGIGPMAGLQAALLATRTDFVAVVAVDLPRIDADWFRWLAGCCDAGRGAIAQHPGGLLEPLAAIYPRTALPEINARVCGTNFSLQSLAAALITQQSVTAVPLPAERLDHLHNWNEPVNSA